MKRHTPSSLPVLTALAFLCLVACAWLSAVAAVAPLPQRPATGGQTPATPLQRYRTSVDAIVLDVTVLDHDRRPVRGLRAENFTVVEDGQPQRIASFDAIEFPDAVATPAAAAWTREVVPDVRTNAEVKDKRIVAILMDDATPMPGADVPHARAMARQTIGSLGPADLAAVVFVLDRKSGQEFTTDKARLLAAVGRFNGSSDQVFDVNAQGARSASPTPKSLAFDEFGLVAAGLYRQTINTLRGLADRLAALPERRKAVLFISTGVPLDVETGEPNVTMGGGDVAGMAKQCITELNEAFRAAGRANVNIYSVDPGGLRAPYDGTVFSADPTNPGRLNREFLQAVAENTGGFAIVQTNDPVPGVEQALRENGSYYLLGYVSSNTRSEGRYRGIDVRVNRRDVTVRTRKGYFEPKSGRASAAMAAAATARSASVGSALADIVPKTDIPLEVAVAPFASRTGPDAIVAIALHVNQPVPAQRATEEIDVEARALAPSGEIRGSLRQVVTLTLRPSQGGTADYEVLSQLALKPGRYTLRLAAHASTANRTGSVFCDLDVPDFAKDRLSMSGVVLEVRPGFAAAGKDALAALIPVVPTTARVFAAGDTVTVFVRLYERANDAPAPVTITARIVNRTDKTMHTATETIDRVRFVVQGGASGAAPRTADWRFVVPLAGLQPGEYVLLLEAATGFDTIRRPVRFRMR